MSKLKRVFTHKSKLFFIPLTMIIIIGISVWACKNPSGPGIDFSGLVDYIPQSERAAGPGYTGNITYGDSNVINPTNWFGNDTNKCIFRGSGNIHYRIPALLCLTNGDILAFADKRYGGAGDLPNRIEVVVKISTNNGTNWSAESIVTPISSSKQDGHGDTAVVQDRKTGDILAVVAYGNGFIQSEPNNQIRIRVMRSKDNGKTWQGPVDITSQIYGPGCKDPVRRNWYAAFVSSGNGLQMRNGRIMFVINVRETEQSKSATTFKNYVMYSDDGGYKWKVSKESPKNLKGGNEAKVVELNDGSLLMHIRWTPNRLQSRSYDNGETWTEATVISSIPASHSNGDLIVYTSKLNGYDKDRLITLVDSRPWNGSVNANQGGPGNPVFHVSYDEGQTWQYKKQLWSGAAGYSSLAVLKDGSIGILAELTQPWNGPIWFLRASIEWVNPNDNPTSPNKK